MSVLITGGDRFLDASFALDYLMQSQAPVLKLKTLSGSGNLQIQPFSQGNVPYLMNVSIKRYDHFVIHKSHRDEVSCGFHKMGYK